MFRLARAARVRSPWSRRRTRRPLSVQRRFVSSCRSHQAAAPSRVAHLCQELAKSDGLDRGRRKQGGRGGHDRARRSGARLATRATTS